MAPNFIDLFSGAGGLGIGLSKAGFTPLISLDADSDSLETLSKHSNHEIVNTDINSFIVELEQRKRKFPNVDLLAGGPPCQGFCSINPNRNENDPRNSLVDAFLHVVSILKPNTVLIENVTGLLSLAKGYAINKIENRLMALGYQVSYKVLQAAHYGVPQSRWRLFVVGYKRGQFSFPEPTHEASITPNFVRGRELTFTIKSKDLFSNMLNKNTVWDAISDLPSLINGGGLPEVPYDQQSQTDYQIARRQHSAMLHNHVVKKLQSVNLQRVSALPSEGMNWTDLPEGLMPENLKRMREKYKGRVGSKTRFQRLRKSGLFSTIVTSPDPYWGAFIHPEQNRVISVREAARAQSFDDNIKFYGSLNSQYRQIGNAVPPLLATAIGEKLLDVV